MLKHASSSDDVLRFTHADRLQSITFLTNDHVLVKSRSSSFQSLLMARLKDVGLERKLRKNAWLSSKQNAQTCQMCMQMFTLVMQVQLR